MPAAEVRRVEFGFRHPDGAEAKRSTIWFRNSGTVVCCAPRSRGGRATSLSRTRFSRPGNASKSTDAETAKRASELVQKMEDKLPPERLKFKDYDLGIGDWTLLHAGESRRRRFRVIPPIWRGEIAGGGSAFKRARPRSPARQPCKWTQASTPIRPTGSGWRQTSS